MGSSDAKSAIQEAFAANSRRQMFKHKEIVFILQQRGFANSETIIKELLIEGWLFYTSIKSRHYSIAGL